jgi:hypothetical protein
VPAIQCPAHLRSPKKHQLCDLPGNGKTHGLCCTTKQNHTTSEEQNKKMPSLRESENEIFHEATHEFDSIMHEQVNQKQVPQKGDDFHGSEPDFFHQMVFGNHRPVEAVEVNSLVNSG